MKPLIPSPRRRPLLPALLLLAGCSADAAVSDLDPNLYTVSRRNLAITVKENAELQAQRETYVRSQVEGQATIIYIVEEGKIVEQGEKLVELDASELVDKQANQKISVTKAKAALDQAEKSLEILQKELKTKENTAKSDLVLAKMELEKFLGRRLPPGGPVADKDRAKNADMVDKLSTLVRESAAEAQKPGPGAVAKASADAAPEAAPQPPEMLVSQVDPSSYERLIGKVRQLLRDVPVIDPDAPDFDVKSVPLEDAIGYAMGDMANQVLQQIDQIRLAMADLKLKEDTLGYSLRLASKSYITRNELDKDKLAYQSQVSKVTLAWNELDLLVNYDLFKTRIKLFQDVDNAKLELERVQASNEAEKNKAQTDFESKRDEYNLAKERLDNYAKQIANAVILAPTPGLVIYARLERGGRNNETVREGSQVRERQDLIVLPDTSRMQAVVKVQEAVVAQVRVGQRAHVSVEAQPDRIYTGRVTRIAQQADSGGGWMSSDRSVYTTVVEIDGENSSGDLRSRMKAAVTIMVDELHDVLTVPMQAVRRDRAANFVWKLEAAGPRAVPVEVGDHNAEHVVIKQGLVEGDRVFLAPPAGVQEPNLPQPEVPALQLPTGPEAPANGTPANGSAANGNGPGVAPLGSGDEPGTRQGRRRGDGQNPGGGRRGPMKKLAEMSAEELDQYRNGLGMWSRTIDRMRENGQAEQAGAIETDLADLHKALDANKLDEAQALADKLMAAIRQGRGMRGGNRRGGDGQPAEGDDRSTRGN